MNADVDDNAQTQRIVTPQPSQISCDYNTEKTIQSEVLKDDSVVMSHRDGLKTPANHRGQKRSATK